MPTFPASSSVLASGPLADFIGLRYGFGGSAACRLLKAGINHSYLVTDGAMRYVFRIYSHNWRSEAEILEELRLIDLLKQHGIPVSFPVKDASGGYLQLLEAPEGPRHGVMFSYAEGEKMLNFPAELHYECGVAMGRMHHVTEGVRLGRVVYSAATLLDPALERLAAFLDAGTEEFRFVAAARDFVNRTFAGADRNQIRTGAVHLDLWFDNMHFSSPTGGATFFDFDFCGNGWLCLDVGYYLMQLRNTEKDDEAWRAKREAFLRGYESAAPLSGEERRLLPAAGMAVFIFFLGVQCQRYDDWSNVFLNEIHIKRFVRLILMRWSEENGMEIAADPDGAVH